MQHVQPIGTVEWADDLPDPHMASEEINESTEKASIFSVVYGDDWLVVPDEDGDWTYLGKVEEKSNGKGIYEVTDKMADELDEKMFLVDIAGEGGRFIFAEYE